MTSLEEDARAFSEEAVKDFGSEVTHIISSALPLRDEEILIDADENEDNGVFVLSYKAPLFYGRRPCTPSCRNETSKSDLYSIFIEYKLTADRAQKFLSVQNSSYQIRVHTKPGVRFEYERNKSRVPAAHIHFTGVGGLLSPALMKNGGTSKKDERKQGDLGALHLPVGGHRFRPSIEDFLYFVVEECGFTGRFGWEEQLKQSREKWLDIQLRASVRDNPIVAAEALRQLGFEVRGPKLEESVPKRRQSW